MAGMHCVVAAHADERSVCGCHICISHTRRPRIAALGPTPSRRAAAAAADRSLVSGEVLEAMHARHAAATAALAGGISVAGVTLGGGDKAPALTNQVRSLRPCAPLPVRAPLRLSWLGCVCMCMCGFARAAVVC